MSRRGCAAAVDDHVWKTSDESGSPGHPRGQRAPKIVGRLPTLYVPRVIRAGYPQAGGLRGREQLVWPARTERNGTLRPGLGFSSMAERQPPASFAKRLEALAITPLLFVVTLGVGWLIWAVIEGRDGRTPSYRILGLRVVRGPGDRPIRLARSLVRSGACCLLLVPTIAASCVIGFCFIFGASPPDDLFTHPRTAPWDYLTGTRIIDESAQARTGRGDPHDLLLPIDLSGATRPSGQPWNGGPLNA
jgi:uncharacterized RDD family membrane protein YckC